MPYLGITVLQAFCSGVYSRYVVDLNRSLQEPFLGNFWQSVVAEKTAFNTAIIELRLQEKRLSSELSNTIVPITNSFKLC
ncbi:hypothetical protein JOY44_22080 [Phormidium sp. CLA17]|uniref:hypothetical protein n=1 Tax=Leptolyngbya sp. Cla-17 TaxID=2803751 RepID=UPI0018DA1C7D|nr:hypothetical protein [Leptolyngbya sp. Cla-17]MBM0744268.1 hypothetical protein [Leptolyngbya sp. Cla-17]